MRVDDIQWQYNKTAGQYELYCYGHYDQRVTFLEFAPMVLLQVASRILDRIHHDFPSTNPPLRTTNPQPVVNERDENETSGNS